jgi:Xaa-Pro dipeptidase
MSGLPFPAPEFEERLARVQAAAAAAGVDAVVLTRPENIFYVTGYRAAHIAARTSELHVAVVPREGEPRILCRALEEQTVTTQWTRSPRLFADHENPYALLHEVLRESGSDGGRVGVEERTLRVSQFRRMQAELPSATFVDVSGLVERVAARTTPAEADCMRRAARITDLGMAAGLAAITEGTHGYEVIATIHEAMYRAGQSDFDRSLVAVWSGPRGGRMHDTLTTEDIRRGDVVTIEIMGVDTHYRAGTQACRFVGDEVPAEVAAAYGLVAEMHRRAQAAVRPGATGGDVFAAANAAYRAARGRDYYRRVGGSLGLTQFTLDLVKDNPAELTPGVSLLIQTLIDDPVLLTCASTVTVTADGYVELTRPIYGLTEAR